MWQARRDTENHESGDGGGWSVWPQEVALLSAPTSFKLACRLNLTQSFFQETHVILKEQFTQKMALCSHEQLMISVSDCSKCSLTQTYFHIWVDYNLHLGTQYVPTIFLSL